MDSYQDLLNRIDELESIIERQNEDLELLEAAFNLSEVGFTLSDANGVVIKINQSQIRITGHQPHKTLGRSMADIQAENFNQSATMKVVNTKEPVTIEQTLPSGKSYLVYGQPYFSTDGDLKYVICNLVDNTQHNYIRQELESAKNSNKQLEKTVHQLQEIVDMQKTLIYCSKKMQGLISVCDKVAHFNSTILILGQSGAGKEVIADYIYQKSSRVGKPFIKINCAAIPETLLESELFGYEAGAFTNACTSGKKGMFEIADGGTVLLDEIGELPLHLQSKLLRVLQEGEFYHVGGTKPISTDVRIIASTNCDLENMTEQGSFRKDLYYRLSVIQITVPSLDERIEDIPPLIRHFLVRFNAKYNLHKDFTFEAIEYLKNLPYEGNIRDLQNVIERVVLLSQNNTIGVQDVELALNRDYSYYGADIAVSDNNSNISLKALVSQYEKALLKKYWDEYKSASKIAEILQTNQPTISRKLHAYGLLK
ncbi:sigma-54 interaction domain-containing protein [Sinanaerobacter chloroacetimidivorans]|jgi:TyrR family helix-turn-helix protein/PAS domain S-box-containing protein|uniref:HTH-type transcriptional regulatory protein TyrR n=1 Tax=Sinanaerobacter chloroacetimidivorans TaxID=2818044 RepID=A0A8J8B127_9FIRM|nr:sigma 54-interacting transcriptional regulator [Sinanaerobacter chloroacetimidivorans]MBR0597804.1 sigma 54-interacting transcriptional regulator [Sinanaerobacter chloroacetimidivorans]